MKKRKNKYEEEKKQKTKKKRLLCNSKITIIVVFLLAYIADSYAITDPLNIILNAALTITAIIICFKIKKSCSLGNTRSLYLKNEIITGLLLMMIFISIKLFIF